MVSSSRVTGRIALVAGALLLGALLVLAGTLERAYGGPALAGLEGFHRGVTTTSQESQRKFDQGLALYYGFNHEEAIRSFQDAARLDPRCAMAYWGMAISAGPNINNPTMDEAASRAAFEAVQKALSLADTAPAVELSLIRALAKRYAWPAPDDRGALDRAYAEAMREAWTAHRADADVGALFAESLLDLRPWDQWTTDGKPQPGTLEVIATLDSVLELNPRHPGANHFYVHTMEASPEPERALASANMLRDLLPGAGHLVHMPSHIDIRIGHYEEAVRANQRAIKADLAYVNAVGRHGFYTMYRAHNYHFLAYAAMFDGQREVALGAAKEMLAELPLEVVRSSPDFIESFCALPYHVMVRFGMWKELVEQPEPAPELLVTRAFWRYARTVALSALGRVDEAATELAAFDRAYAEVPDSRLIGNNPARLVLELARPMAEGELEYRRGNHDRAFELLREAVRRDDSLRYDEPWGWMQPVRHALGALLLEQGRLDEAEVVYRKDLELHPGNGWALHGLAETFRRSGRVEEAAVAEQTLTAAWSRSDVPLKASCYCRRNAA